MKTVQQNLIEDKKISKLLKT